MSNRLLALNQLNAHYGDFQALFEVNSFVDRGEIVAIIGANGAGKSTLLRSISGLLNNEEKQINFIDQPIGNMRADKIAHEGIALVPEGRQLFPSLSVEENLKLGGSIKREGRWSLSSVYELFPILHERKDYPATSLSGGQQQMVAIGRALMANPQLILFDEISLGLAPVIIDSVYQAIPKIVSEGVSAIIVEQDISRALAVSSRFYCLQEGRITLTGNSATADREQITKAYFGVAA